MGRKISWALMGLVVFGCADGADEPGMGKFSVTGPMPIGTAGMGAAGNPAMQNPPAGAAGTVAMPPRAGTGSVMGTSGVSGGGTAGVGQMPMAGMGEVPMAGMGAAGMGAAGTGGTTPAPGSKEPIVPAVSETCPEFRDGTIMFMGLGGIQIVAGSKPSSPTAPMVFYWHGTGSFAGEFATMAGAVRQGVVQEGGVLVSFQGTTGGDLLSGTSIFGAGDFELTDQLLACAVQNHNVDPRRVFATGCSAGGLFSGAMAAARSNYMAAVAPNSGGWTVPVQWQNDWTPALMTIHGAAGRDVVIVDFSNTSATADMAFKARGGFVINCDHGGGHCGGGGLAPSIWEFFKAHPYGIDPHPWTSLPAGFHDSCEIL